MVGTFWSLVPAIIAIALALVTKEVYSSLFVGIVIGGLFYSGLSFTGFLTHVFDEGLVKQLSDSSRKTGTKAYQVKDWRSDCNNLSWNPYFYR